MRKHRYTAFTLAEMMVVMLIMSIILAAMAPVMTTRNKTDNSSPWRYTPQNSSNAYFGAAQSMKALIGQVNAVADGDNGKLVINTMGTSLSHILFKSNNSVLGDLYFNDSSIVLGNRMNPALTIGRENINIGHNNWSNAVNLTGSSNITIGDASMQSLSEGRHNIGIGTTLSAVTTGDHNVAVGDNALIRTTGEGNIAIGGEANQTSNTDATIAIGLHSSATGTNSIAIGSSSDTTNSNNDATSATGASSIAIGFNSSGTAGSAMAIGNSATAEDTNAIAIGGGAGAKSSNSIAIGTSVDALGSSSVAIGGNGTGTNGDSAVAIGNAATASTNAITINGTASGNSSIAIGPSSLSTNSSSVAIGNDANATGVNSVALGQNVYSTGSYSIAIGFADATGNASIALGYSTIARENYTTAIGSSAFASGQYSTAVGYAASTKGLRNTAIGYRACSNVTGSNKTCIGANSGPASSSSWASDSDERIFIGGQSKFNGGPAVLEVHNSDNTYKFRYDKPGYKTKDSTVVVNGNLMVKGYVYSSLWYSEHDYDRLGFYGVRDGRGMDWFDYHSGSGSDDYMPVYASHGAFIGYNGQTQKSYEILSDRRLKYVGKENKSGLDKIRQLKVFNYTFRKDATKTPHVGVIAQDLQKVFPNAVKKGTDGFLTVRMEDMFFAVINAIKELDSRVTALEKENIELKARLDRLEAKVK